MTEGAHLTGRPKICRVSLTMPRFIHITTFGPERETYLNDNGEQCVGFGAAKRGEKNPLHHPWFISHGAGPHLNTLP